MTYVGRRAVLKTLGGLALSGAGLAGLGSLTGCTSGAPGSGGTGGTSGSGTPLAGGALPGAGTPVAGRAGAWLAERHAPYGIGHRGAGDLAPEHTLESYRAALDAGARCVEISAVVTADGVPICLHDLTLDRTTTLRGRVADMPYEQVKEGFVDVPRLGPAWAGANRPRIPPLEAALALVTGSAPSTSGPGPAGAGAVVCLEAKEDRGYPAVMAVARRLGVADAVIAKLYCRSARIEEAQREFPVFVYAGTDQDLAPEFLAATARRLRPDRDALVLPTRVGGPKGEVPIGADVVRQAVDSGVPVWAYPVHRRSELARLAGLGVAGFVTPDLGYVLGSGPAQRADDWAAGRPAAGQLTRDPYADTEIVRWGEADAGGSVSAADGSITLDAARRTIWVLLGQFAPVSGGGRGAETGAVGSTTYGLAFDGCFRSLPADRTRHIGVAFAHADDRHWAHREGTADGYHALLGADGRLSLWRHTRGSAESEQLGATVATTPPAAGEWVSLRVDVTAEEITWTRAGFPPVRVRDGRHRGGYVLIGRTGVDGAVGVRHFRVTTP